MTPDRWRQVTAIFHAARGHEAGLREEYLDGACGSDASLRAELNALLEAHAEATSLGAVDVALEQLPQLSPLNAASPRAVRFSGRRRF